MKASFFSKPLSQLECRIKITSQLLSESECRNLCHDLTQKTETNKISEARHNADKHYLFNIDVDRKGSFLKNTIVCYNRVVVVFELVVSGTQCIHNKTPSFRIKPFLCGQLVRILIDHKREVIFLRLLILMILNKTSRVIRFSDLKRATVA